MTVRQKVYLYMISRLRNKLSAACSFASKPVVYKMLCYFTPAQTRHVAQSTCAASHGFLEIKLLIVENFVMWRLAFGSHARGLAAAALCA